DLAREPEQHDPRRRRRDRLAQRASVQPAQRPERHRGDPRLDPRLLALARLAGELPADLVRAAGELERAAEIAGAVIVVAGTRRLLGDERGLALAQLVAFGLLRGTRLAGLLERRLLARALRLGVGSDLGLERGQLVSNRPVVLGHLGTMA